MKRNHAKAFYKVLVFFIFTIVFQNVKADNRVEALKKLSLFNFQSKIVDTTKRDLKNAGKPDDDDEGDIFERQRQEAKKIRDPALNIVPVERLIEARKIKDQLLISQTKFRSLNSAPSNTTSINTLQWTERGPTNVGGRTRALMFDLNDKANGYKKVFAGGVDGGLWYTTDITAAPVTWHKIDDFFDNIAISCITQNPVNPLEIYVGTGEGWFNSDSVQGLGVWKTSDGGITWTRLTSTINFLDVNAILVDKNGNLYVAGLNFGIQKSSDGGFTWAQVLGNPVLGVSFNAADLQLAANGDIYASLGSGFDVGQIYMTDFSVNGAATGNSGTWKNITPDSTGVVTSSTANWWRIKLACAPGNPNVVYALFEGSGQRSMTSVQRYDKSTSTWVVKTVPIGPFSNGQAWYSLASAVDPKNDNALWIGSLYAVKSIDGGATWTSPKTQNVHPDHHTYTYAPGSSSRLLIGTDGGVTYTENADTTTTASPDFFSKDNGYDVTQFYSVALHPTSNNYILAGSQDNGTQQFTSPGLNATGTITGGDGGFTFIDQLNGNIQITSYIYNNYFIFNGGILTIRFFNNNGSFINPSDYDSKQKNLFSGNLPGTYFRWKNVINPAAADTATVKVAGFKNFDVSAVTVSPITNNRVYFGLVNGTIAVVDNADVGISNTSVILTPSTTYGAVSCVDVDPKSEDHILVSYFNYGVVSLYETINATAANPIWTAVEGNLPDMPVRWAMFYPGDPTRAIIATELGVWTTDALSGTSTIWQPSNSGLANVEVDMLKFRASDRTLAAATHGRGLFTTILPAIGIPGQTIIFLLPGSVTYGSADIVSAAISTNNTIPITYNSSDTTVATITANGNIHIVRPGITTITASQIGDLNYSPATPVNQTLTVKPAILTVTANNQIKTYGNVNPPLTMSYSGFVNGDDSTKLTNKPTISTTSITTSPAGNYPITISGGTAANYTFNYLSGTLTVTPATLTVKANNQSKIVGDPNPLLTVICSGFVNGDDTTKLTAKPIITTTATTNSPVGAYPITASGASAANYTFNYMAGTLTVKPIPAPVIISFTPSSAIPGTTVTITGTNFSGATVVNFGNAPAAPFTVVSSTSITAVVGNGASGNVSVTTPAGTGTLAGFNFVYDLPNTNFELTITSATCRGSNDGSVNITAVQSLSYTATITGNGLNTAYPFTASQDIPNLSPGTYSVCITVAGQPNYQQCYNVVITQPADLSVYTTVNNTTNSVNLALNGGAQYSIRLNGMFYTTSNNTITLPLQAGDNDLVVATDRLCQGTIERHINISGQISPYPVPFQNTLNVNLGMENIKNVSVEIHNTPDGALVFSKQYVNQSGVLQLDLTGLRIGVYSLYLLMDNSEKIFKIIKQ